MRVIAGKKKGFHLAPVPGKSTRPTADKVKESIFNIIGPYFDGGQVLDLYAGTGNLGIEALSRGADHSVFIDANRKAVGVILRNLEATDFLSQAEVYTNDANRALQILIKKQAQYDLIFLDPPYREQKIESQLAVIGDHGLLKKRGIIIAEHDADQYFPDHIGNLYNVRRIVYGDTGVTLYRLQDGADMHSNPDTNTNENADSNAKGES